MSKMSELSTMIESLIECGQTLINVGKGLKAFYSETTSEEKEVVKAATPAEEPKAVNMSFEDVRKVLAAKSSESDGKFKAEVKELVAKYSSNGTLRGVPEDKYSELIKDAEVIGNG